MSSIHACADPPPALQTARQALLVVSPEWSATSGRLYRLHRAPGEDRWEVLAPGLPVSLGRQGMAPGVGFTLPSSPAALRKREGDDRAPAGVFGISRAFGFRAEMKHETQLPFLLVTSTLEAIDDPASRFYNQIIEVAPGSPRDWRASEKMRAIPTYRLGLVVEYNTHRPEPGAGSCIFLHCWKSPHEATSGCTALAEEDLSDLLRWLDPAAHPVLIQLPQSAFAALQESWGLPLPGLLVH